MVPSRRGSEKLSLLLSLLICVSACSVNGLYEDQIGMWDWHRQYVGKATHAVFNTAGTKKRLFVATEQSALASLNLRTGQLLWRHILAADDAVDQLASTSKALLSVSGGGKLVRAWNPSDGTVLWEALGAVPQEGSSSKGALHLLPLSTGSEKEGSPDLFLLANGTITALSSASGLVLWSHTLSSSTSPQKLAIRTAESILVVGVEEGSQASGLTVTELSQATGDLINDQSIPSPHSLSPSSLVLTTDGVAVALSKDGTHLFTLPLDNLGKPSDKPLTSLGLPSKPQLLHAQLKGAVALSANGAIAVLDISGQKTLSTGLLAVSDSVETLEGQPVFAAAKSENNENLTLEVFGGGDNSFLQERVAWGADRGGVSRLFVSVYSKKDGGNGYRFLVVGGDDSLALLQQGEVVWVREEALAGVVGVKILDPPVGKDESMVANVEAGIEEWAREQILAAKVTLMLASEEDKLALATARKFRPDKLKPTRDHNGFRRYIVLLTTSGKVAALHTGDGRLIWAMMTSAVATPRQLLLWKVPHDKESAPQVLVVGSSKDGNGALSYIDSYTGQELDSEELPFATQQAIQLPYKDSQEQKLLMLVSTDGGVYLRPDSDEARAIFTEHARSIFYYSVDKAGGVITGYAVVPRGSRDSSDGSVADTVEAWTVAFPKHSEEIAAVAATRADEAVHSLVRVLGDRSVLYKYLNRNTLFVVTTSAPQAPEDSTLVAHLLDAATGRVLYRIVHPDMRGPVEAVMSENWVVYSYFNARAFRQELSVLEVYDEAKGEQGGSLLGAMLGLQNGSAPVSSLTPPRLKVLGQSYFFPSSVKSLGVTVTEKGITNRQVLVGTGADQVMALDRRLVDPRRPVIPTTADREEGLIPYSEALPLMPQAFITHGLQVEGLRGIYTAPARLESTSLVFAYGVDLFFTRATPSKTYDLLTEDFSYALLVLTVVVLVVAIVVSAAFAKRKELKSRWK